MDMTYEMEKMFEENVNLIHATIRTYIKCPGMYGLNDYDDLVQIGRIGLYKAIEKYDQSKGKFSTYAVPIIRNHLYNALRDAGDIDNTIALNDEWIEMNKDLAYDSAVEISNDMTMKEGMGIISSCATRYGGIAEKGARAIQLKLLGYDCNDIAEMYGVEAKTVTAWMSRARKKLQKEPELLRLLDMA